jgi:DNA-binding beta-propeller fold protein YncE
MRFLPLLIPVCLLLVPGAASAGPNADAKVALHARAPITKSPCTSSLLDLDCADLVTHVTPASYFVYVMVVRGDSTAGIAGVEFGINYQKIGMPTGVAADGNYVDIHEWHLCADVEFTTGNWPDRLSGNRLTWNATNRCQRDSPASTPGDVTAIAGYFYCTAYDPDRLQLTPHPESGFATVASCDGAADTLTSDPSPALGAVAFNNTSAPGLNPCDPPPPTPPSTYLAPGHGSLSASFRHAFRLFATPNMLGDTTQACTSAPAGGWRHCQFDSVANTLLAGTSAPFSGRFPKQSDYFSFRDLDSRPDYLLIPIPGSPGDTLTHIDLEIYHEEDRCTVIEGTGGYASGEVASVLGSAPGDCNDMVVEPRTSARAVAVDSYVLSHEIGHVLSALNHNDVGNAFSDEFFATLNEYVAGSRYTGSTHAFPVDYDISLHHLASPNFEVDRSGRYIDKYDEYRLFGAYLFHQFPGPSPSATDDLVYQWVRTTSGYDSTYGAYPRITLPGLAYYLDDAHLPNDLRSYYSARFPSGDGDDRVAQLFQRYGVARFLDSKDGAFHAGRYGFESAIKPWDNFGLFHNDPNPALHYGAWIRPPEFVLDDQFLASGAVSLPAVWTDPGDALSTERTEVWTWATDYVIFRADSADFAGLGSYPDVVVQFESEGSVPANQRVFVSAITYDQSRTDLYEHGDRVLDVETTEAVYDDCHFTASLEIPDFGDDTKAVVVCISMTEDALDPDAPEPSRLSYRLFLTTTEQPVALCPLVNPGYEFSMGSEGNGAGQFEAPGDMIVVGDTIYVADQLDESVKRFTIGGATVGEWTAYGFPRGLLYKNGGIYVTAAQDEKIRKYTTSGTFLFEWGGHGTGNGQFFYPWDIAANDDGDRLYVADLENDRIQIFNASGAYIGQFGSSGSGPGEFDGPRSVAVDVGGYVYVADSGNHRIQKFDPDGDFILMWGLEGGRTGEFGNSLELALDDAYYVFVADTENHRIQYFDPNGHHIGGRGSYGIGPARFRNPTAVSDDGAIVMDAANYRIQVFGIGSTGVPEEAAPTASLTLGRPYPNPAAGVSRLDYRVPDGLPPGERITITVFDVAGRRVRRLLDEPAVAGGRVAIWDGRDDSGSLVGGGIYFAAVQLTSRPLESRKIVRR